jgi:hypothetical protein
MEWKVRVSQLNRVGRVVDGGEREEEEEDEFSLNILCDPYRKRGDFQLKMEEERERNKSKRREPKAENAQNRNKIKQFDAIGEEISTQQSAASELGRRIRSTESLRPSGCFISDPLPHRIKE